MRSLALILVGLAVVLSSAGPAEAASLRAAPVILDLTSPAAASTVRVWNDADRPINVQIRVFRWVQRNGEDVLEPTDAVVASPPITTLEPGGEHLIRVVRTSDRPVEGEEDYRLLVDELPDPSRRRGGTITLVVRHSIPVFFSTAEASDPAPAWTVERRDGGYAVTVRNDGTRRLKVSDLTLSDGGTTVARQAGLVGYVLGHSTATWFVPGTGAGPSGDQITITADSEAGRFDATVRLQGG